jgi:hypothetical protein
VTDVKTILKTAMLGALIASAIAPAALAKGGKDFYRRTTSSINR